MDDNWMADVLDRANARYERERAERKARATQFSAIFWPVFFAVALGVPVGLWLSSLDFGGLVGSIWQTALERLAG